MFSTPGAAVTPPLRSSPDDEIIINEMFRSYVGRIMFACGKTEPTLYAALPGTHGNVSATFTSERHATVNFENLSCK